MGFRGKGSDRVANRAYKFRMYPNDEQKILFA
ncbi:helix-turn-helix domain-containing protein, partial [Anaerobutyricum hallii]